MKKTGNKIVVNVFVKGEFQDVPVMRNGKPTKRTKRQWVPIYEDRELTDIEVQGHEIFIDEKENHESIRFKGIYMAFKADGERLTVECKYGSQGTKLHQSCGFYSEKYNNIISRDNGWDGPLGKGSGARIVKINW